MSHVANVNLQIASLKTLASAVKTLGGEFRENQTTHKWYGRAVGGALPGGRDVATMGKCLHAIRFPGINYEIGVVSHASGKGFDLVYDNFGSGGQHDGMLLAERLGGAGLPKIKQGYAAVAAKREMQMKGYNVTQTLDAAGYVELIGSK